jgi:hypothetical protein
MHGSTMMFNDSQATAPYTCGMVFICEYATAAVADAIPPSLMGTSSDWVCNMNGSTAIRMNHFDPEPTVLMRIEVLLE